jgi:hypothetical protein
LIFTVQSGTGYTVGSPSSGTGTIADNDSAPALPTVTINDGTVTEGNNGGPTVTVTLTVTRSGDLSGTSTINWTTTPGQAVAGSDFVAASGTLTFSPGQATKTITITIASDKKAEQTETFSVTLTIPTGGNAVFGDNTGVVTILDNDGALLTSSAPVTPGAGAALSPRLVPTLLDAAIREWIAAGAAPAALASVRFVIDDLPGLKLAETFGSMITIDLDAAGWGWDVTPGAVEAGRIDLLSVLRHELGHVLGYEHDDLALMGETIDPGTTLTLERAGPISSVSGARATETTIHRGHASDRAPTSAHASAVAVGVVSDASRRLTIEAINLEPVTWPVSVFTEASRTVRKIEDAASRPTQMRLSIMLDLAIGLLVLAALRSRRLRGIPSAGGMTRARGLPSVGTGDVAVARRQRDPRGRQRR